MVCYAVNQKYKLSNNTRKVIHIWCLFLCFLLVYLLIKTVTQWAYYISWGSRFYDTPKMCCYAVIRHN